MAKKGYLRGRKMQSVALDLPTPPSVNALWRYGNGHMYRSAEYDRWRNDAGWTLKAQKPPQIEGWVGLKIYAAIPQRRRDLDNLNKALADLVVEHGIIEDDAFVASIDARWDKTIPSGRVRLEVRTTVAPEERISAQTRKRIKEANTRRQVTCVPAETAETS
jgi:crossover junction endodeoxyribonuclease RusA